MQTRFERDSCITIETSARQEPYLESEKEMDLTEAQYILDNMDDYDDPEVFDAERVVRFHSSNAWGR